MSVNPLYAPGHVTATLYLSLTGGLGVLPILDPQLAHAWPELNYWNFIEVMPKRMWPPPYHVFVPVAVR